MWNIMSVSHDRKTASSREDAIFMFNIIFLGAVTGSTGCITEN